MKILDKIESINISLSDRFRNNHNCFNYCVLIDKTAEQIIEFAKEINSSNENPIYIIPFCTKSLDEMPDYNLLIGNKHCLRVNTPMYIGNFDNKREVIASYISLIGF